MTESAEGEALREALVGAYRPRVAARCVRLGIRPPDGLDAALRDGEEWLDRTLALLLSRPFHAQDRGPLEIFQEAMRFPTEALRTAGVAPAERDEAVRAALPGDLYDLAPASSADLGEEVWRAHLAWGAAKAARLARPTVGLLSADLMDRSRIETVVSGAGFRMIAWSEEREATAALAGARPALVLVDLAHSGADAVIVAGARAGVRVIGFGPHVDDLAMVRARSLGAADALPRAAFFRGLTGLLPTPA